MTLSIAVNGGSISNPLHIEARRTLDEVAGSFTFSLQNGQGLLVGRDFRGNISVSTLLSPIVLEPQIGNLVEVFADGILWLTGFIEQIQIQYSKGSHIVNFSGRSKTADLIDSTMDSITVEYKPPLSLKNLSEKVITSLGSESPIQVIIDADFNPPTDFTQDELIGGDIGQSVFDFLLQYATKRQLLVTHNAEGNLVYTDNIRFASLLPEYNLQNTFGIGNNSNNNIVSSDSTYDVTDRFRNYICRSQTGSQQVKTVSTATPTQITNTSGTSEDDQIRKGRKYVMIAENTSDNIQCTNRAKWEANIRRARSFKYSVQVQGHSVTRKSVLPNRSNIIESRPDLEPSLLLPWEPGRRTTVNDVFVTPLTELIINSVHMVYDLGDSNGSVTNLECLTPDAYTLLSSEPQSVKEQKQQGVISFMPEVPPPIPDSSGNRPSN